ncbi:hypothetical protein ACWELO_36715, partial [Streptomyces sp. NPDC004596]
MGRARSEWTCGRGKPDASATVLLTATGELARCGETPRSEALDHTRLLECISFGESAVADEGAGNAREGEEVVGLAFV